MIVYRICKKEEFNKIFIDNNFNNVGYSFSNSNINTHKYIKGNKYLHFFLKFDSIFYLRTLKERFLCIYDIDEDILRKYQGIGYYWDYINYTNLNEVIEYAIINTVLNINNIKQVSYIKDNIDYEDYLLENNIDYFLEPVYFAKEEKRLKLE